MSTLSAPLPRESKGVVSDTDIGSIKEELRKQFAERADTFMDKLRQIEQAIGALAGSLPVS